MRLLISFLFFFSFGVSVFGANIKAYATNPPLSFMLYIISPESMIGLPYKPYKEDLTFLLPSVSKLPVIGMVGGGKEINLEMLLSKKPSIVFVSHSMKDSATDFEEKLKKFNIKVVYLKSQNIIESLDSMVIMGEYLGKKERALALKNYALDLLKDLESKKVTNYPSVYFAQGISGLESECGDGSINDVAKNIGGTNIIQCDDLADSVKNGRISINIERIIERNPSFIFVREIAFYNELKANPPIKWRNISAIKNNKVYYAPSSPSNWLSRPPSLMRIIGFPWAFNIIHPEIDLGFDLNAKIKEFYALFLHYENLSDEDIERLEKGE
ncbi:hypothetical protein CCY99_01355 [Helicobacter sp. 16-1353]|uniref:ABC transporter substrate-binding protein n=1 Tax=Helicobacter sp. 16-1353 TaxID=2004996 RepID=UPI000DCD0F61|nr:ABC transporter substrate-binding protein [Helicobacter sp. 16-1353]RAX54834.1 hypothetical protein CCY99_01355 [Helicobacter sp. 16-1353]